MRFDAGDGPGEGKTYTISRHVSAMGVRYAKYAILYFVESGILSVFLVVFGMGATGGSGAAAVVLALLVGVVNVLLLFRFVAKMIEEQVPGRDGPSTA